MQSETKQCQNCQQKFTIEPDDFNFYEKIKVPPPTFCPECRMIRRMLFRNERSLYRQNCDLCKKSMISMYDPEKKYTVYCIDCYNSDNWDSLKFGKKYDFTRPFFEQLGELFKSIPRRALYQDFAVNSEYTNQIVHINNSYLCFGGHHYEDCAYCAQNFFLRNCLDVDFSSNCEFCYESLYLRKCFRVRFGYYSEDCLDSWFLYDCRNCQNCFGCVGLRNKNNCIFNKQYSKEEYGQKIKELILSNQEDLKKIKSEFWKNNLLFPKKYVNIKNIVNSVGDNLEQVRNCKYVFSVSEAENVRYSFFIPYGGAKDCFDLDHVGVGTTESYELHSGFGNNRVMFCTRIYYSHNVEYSDDCYNCEYLFACAGLRKKQYCIFNIQYTKEEYESLLSKIKKSMDEIPFIDEKKRVYKYGEFFPIEIMPFAYNDSVVHEYFPLSKEEILGKGYRYKEPDTKNYKPTILAHQLPPIEKADEKILQEIVQCEHIERCNHRCTFAFRIIQNELNISKTLSIPLPNLCPNCRHMERIKFLNPPRLYHRKCQCAGVKSESKAYVNTISHFHESNHCPNEFETSYSPDRPEIIYCEKCYQQEVY